MFGLCRTVAGGRKRVGEIVRVVAHDQIPDRYAGLVFANVPVIVTQIDTIDRLGLINRLRDGDLPVPGKTVDQLGEGQPVGGDFVVADAGVV